MIARNFNNIASQIANNVAHRLSGRRGQQALNSLNFALDFLKPYVRALGLRVARMSNHKIELILPAKVQTLKSQGSLHEGAVITAALEAYQWIWNQNKPETPFVITIRSVNLDIVKALRGNLRFKFELKEINREKVLFELARDQKSEDEAQILIFLEDDQICGQVELRALITQTPVLEWT